MTVLTMTTAPSLQTWGTEPERGERYLNQKRSRAISRELSRDANRRHTRESEGDIEKT